MANSYTIGIVVSGFPDYSITKNGRIWSKHGKGRWIKPTKYKGGYCGVSLQREKKDYFRRVHRLILETYVGLCPKGMETRHLDGNPANNHLDNLCWGTPKENMGDRDLHGRTGRGELNGRCILTESDVRMVIYMYRTGLFMQREIATMYKIDQTTVSAIVSKKIWKFIWSSK